MPTDATLTLPYQWRPRPYQQGLWDYLRAGGTHAVVCAHRRWGKDEVCLHHTACAAFERVGNYGHMLPEYAQGRKAIWDAVNAHTGKKRIDEAFPEAIRKKVNDQEMKIEFRNGSTWQVLGSDHYNALMGTAYAGLVKSEEALSHPGAIGYLSPIMRENHGWMLHISTARGHNHFENLLKTALKTPGWYGEVSTVDQTEVFTHDELQEELHTLMDLHGEAYGRSMWLQEYYCSFEAAVPGAIWAEAIDRATATGRILEFAMKREAPVSTAWDLGRTDDTAIWLYQFNGTGIDLFEHFSASGMDIDNEDEPRKGLVQVLLRLREQYGLTYATHWLPHDARPRTQAAGGKSILQQFHDATTRHPELGRFAIAKKLDRQEGIQAARKTLPRCRFHATRCAKGLNSLRHYHREWDEEQRTYGTEPVHDWCLAGETKILTTSGWRAIQALTVHDHVLTPRGPRAILRHGMVRETAEWVTIQGVRCTPEHRWFSSRGLQRADALTSQERLWTQASWGLRGLAWCLWGSRIGFEDAITLGTRERGERADEQSSFIGWSIRLVSGRFRRAMNSIIETAMHSIPIPLIWKRCHETATDQPINLKAAMTVSAESAAQPSGVTNHGAHAVVSPVNGQTMPAWNVTVEHEHAYFVQGADGQAYLVANSSHDADAFRTMAVSWKQQDAQHPEAPLVDRLLATDTAKQTWGHIVESHLRKHRLAKLERTL